MSIMEPLSANSPTSVTKSVFWYPWLIILSMKACLEIFRPTFNFPKLFYKREGLGAGLINVCIATIKIRLLIERS